ncbi:MAG: ABC transporter permease subunit [Candidatus Aminicenantes bacterium]|nr:ABC transporter permease subunit [Candidatus Aminicenantes bacterium]
MIWTIARKEIASNLLSYKFFIVILLTTLLLFTSFFVLYKDYKGRQADYELVRAKPGEPIAVVPPNPLSIFAKGLDEAMTRSFEISPIGIDVRTGQKSGNAVFAFFPAPDFVYVVKIVLSLVALLFGFDQVSRERENGVLRLMLSNAVSRATVLAGKWLGNFLSLAVPFVLVTLIGFALMNLDPGISFGPSGTGRFLLLIAIALVYIGLFLSLGILVSALTRRSASTLVILLLVWSLLVFVLPNLGTLVARQIIDVPSVKALSEKRTQIWTREILLQIVEQRAVNFRGDGAIRKRHLDAINTELNALEADYRTKFDRLVRLSKTINRLSPAAGFVYAATELAGTGIGEESRLKSEVIRHKDAVLLEMDRGVKEHPAFVYRYRTVGRVLAEGGLFDLAWLTIALILFFALGFVAFVRYDVR